MEKFANCGTSMNLALSVTLALFIGAVCIGLCAPSLIKAAVYASGFALVIAISLVVWFMSFFPNEGTSSQMLSWLASPPSWNLATWILRTAQKVLIASVGATIGYGVKMPFRKSKKKV
jgi:hypothetical protein